MIGAITVALITSLFAIGLLLAFIGSMENKETLEKIGIYMLVLAFIIMVLSVGVILTTDCLKYQTPITEME